MARIQRMLGVRIRPDDADVLRIRAGLMETDRVADAFVAWCQRRPRSEGRALFDAAVEGGLAAARDPPEELVRWFAPLESEPRWLNRDALELACRTSFRAMPTGGDVLSAMSLMGGYRSAAAVKPLARTGALDRMVVRRIAETTRFVADVYESTTMPRFSAGFKSACRVRLMHAMVRAGLARSPTWDFAAWGAPINQSDTAATHLEFSAIYLLGLTLLGYRFDRDERDAVMHLWRYVSVVMGADDTLLAHDFREGLRHTLIHALSNPHADEDSRALASALHRLPTQAAATPLERMRAGLVTRYRTAISRHTLGDAAVDDLGLPRAPWHVLLWGVAGARFGLETLRRWIPGANELAVRRGRQAQRALVDALVERQVEFIPYADRAATPGR